MSRPARIAAKAAAWIIGVIVVLLIAAYLALHTPWFSNYVRGKIASTVEQSTGAKVEVGSFHMDWTSLTFHIRNFVIHGTEPATAAPLLDIPAITVHVKLFSGAGIANVADIAYVGIERPHVDLIVFPDGKTNLPHPKVQKPASSSNGNTLDTVLNLKIGKFDLDHGLIQFNEEKTAFNARGENLHAILNYNGSRPSYQGGLSIDPLILKSGSRPPLNAHIHIPVTIEANAVRIANAQVRTGKSSLLLNASVENLNAPNIQASLKARISLPEMQRSFDIPIQSNAPGAPKVLTAAFQAHIDEQSKKMQVQTAHLALGDTVFQAAGALNGPNKGTIRFSGRLALDQLSRLMNRSTRASGAILLAGAVKLNAQDQYAVDGTVKSRNLALSNGQVHLSNISLYTPFHADPNLIDLNQLQLRALGGELTARLSIKKMQQLSFESHLRHFDLPVIAAVATGKHIGYDGALNGTLKAGGNLRAKGATGLSGQANLAIVPGHRGVPLRGRLVATYSGKTGAIELDRSYLALPHSRLDISGALHQSEAAHQRIDVHLVSHNLNDFLPAMNLVSSGKTATSLPVTLRSGGSAEIQAQITGSLKAPHIASHLALTRFDVEHRPFDGLSMNLQASPSGAEIQDGVLKGALNSHFAARIGLVHWKPEPRSPLAANLALHGSDIGKLAATAGQSSVSVSGALNASAHIHGTYGDPLGSAKLTIDHGSFDGQAFDRVSANVNFADQLIALAPLEVAIGNARIDLTGSLHHPRKSFTTGRVQFHIKTTNLQLADLELVQHENRGIAGLIQLDASAAADIAKPNGKTQVKISNISAKLSATGLQLENQNAGRLTASAQTVNDTVQYTLASNFAGSQIKLNGKTELATNYPTVADASIQNLSIGKTLEMADVHSIPATGMLSASAHVSGTMQAPAANLKFALTEANIYRQPIDSLRGSLDYSNTRVNIPSISLDLPAGKLTLSGEFSHPANNFHAGSLKLRVSSTPIQLAKIEKLTETQPGVAGTLHLAGDVAASFRERNGSPAVRVSEFNANASASDLRMDGHSLGGASFTAHTVGDRVTFSLNSDLAKSQIRGSGEATLTGNYPVRASISFANIRYVNLYPFISSGPQMQPRFNTRIAGELSVNGPILQPKNLNGELKLKTLQLKTLPRSLPTGAPAHRSVTLQNKGPIVVELRNEVLRVQQFHITGPQTHISMGGRVNLRDANSPLGLEVNADMNLAILSDINREIYSSGSLTMKAAIHGTPTQPAVTGTVALKGANLEYTGSPNGISNANAVILLRGTTAQIQSFTGETGGGKVTLSGFASYTNGNAAFNLQAQVQKVRIRYSGASIVTSAGIKLTGNTKHSLISGTVGIDRIAYSGATDAGALLSSASGPPSSPAAPSAFERGMRLDIHVLSSPGLRVVSSYTQSVEVFVDLTVRGTVANPGILGSVRITNGSLLFFGNKYTVNAGTINFYNPYSVEPVLDISLRTVVQGIDVTLGISGSMDDLHLSYHSNPPLTFQQIVQLLATNTTPSTNPSIAAKQPPSQRQSVSQMGASAVLGQAVANPVASRLQHVFGISEFKIDPSFQGSNGLPTARITLKQQITSNLTFTYIEDLSRTNAEIIRIEWNFTPKFSAVATRDWNGVVGVEFLYAFKKR
ncbi:MAG: translocation/assembly module TamB domain-containing protein [Bryobacteraceae bacterium]